MDIKQCVHGVCQHVDSPSADLIVKMVPYSVSLHSLLLEPLSKRKISKLLVFSRI
jgi:hypothetical protein